MNRIHLCTCALALAGALAGCGDDTGGGGAGGGSGSTGTGDGGADASSTGSGSDAPIAGSPAEGIYVFALSSELANHRPILFQGSVIFGDDPDAPSFSLSLTPLRSPYRKGADVDPIAPLTPLPPPLDLGPFDIAPDGSFDAQFPEVQVTGRANAFSPNDLKAVVAIHGKWSEDPNGSPERLGFVCGTLEGEVTSPIARELGVEDNFFSMTKIEGELPNQVAYNCAGDLTEAFIEEESGGAGGGAGND